MKVLITSDWYSPAVNGVVTSILNLKKGLEARGHEVRVLTLSNTMHSYVEDEVTYIGTISAGAVYPGARIRTALAHPLINALIEWHPDVVHSNCEMSTFIMARRIAKRAKIPLVHTYHTVYEDYTHYFSPSKRVGKAIVSKLSNLVANRTSAMIVPSEKVRRLLKGYRIAAPIFVIPTGIDQEKFGNEVDQEWKKSVKEELGVKDGHVIAIYIGRLAKEKHAEELIDYTYSLRDEKLTLLIVGDGPARKSLEKKANSYGLLGRSLAVEDTTGIPGAKPESKDKLASKSRESSFEAEVIFSGAVPPKEVGKYYQLGDIFVSASQSETQGLTYFEALSSGLPLLCRMDECLEGVVDQGINGWSYENEEEFCKYLNNFVSDSASRDTMKEKARETGKRFSVSAFAENVEEVYDLAIVRYKPEQIRAGKSRIRVRSRALARKIKRKAGKFLRK